MIASDFQLHSPTIGINSTTGELEKKQDACVSFFGGFFFSFLLLLLLLFSHGLIDTRNWLCQGSLKLEFIHCIAWGFLFACILMHTSTLRVF